MYVSFLPKYPVYGLGIPIDRPEVAIDLELEN